MKKNGFTLIELLAVIVILSILTLLVGTSITKMLKNSKEDLYEDQLLSIKHAAEIWGSENMSELPESGKCKLLKLSDLKENGLLDSNIVDPRNGNNISDEMLIKITSKLTKYGGLSTSYEVNPNDVSDCVYIYDSGEIVDEPIICQAVTQETASKTSSGALKGFVPFKGNVAPMGEEFICKVNDTKSYHFFVVSKSKITDDADIDLILEDNIDSSGNLSSTAYFAFADSGTIKNGPVKAYDILYNATKDWTNIPSQKFSINYLDSKGGFSYSYRYAAIQQGLQTNILNEDTGDVTASYLELKARLPFTAYDVIGGEYSRGMYWLLDITAPSIKVYHQNGLSSGSVIPYQAAAGVGIRPVITVKGSNIAYN